MTFHRCRKLTLIVILLWLFSHAIIRTVKGQLSPTELQNFAISNKERISALDEQIHTLRTDLNTLQLQQRLTALESTSQSINTQVQRVVDWQDKFQWALLALLGEAVLRIFTALKSRMEFKDSAKESV